MRDLQRLQSRLKELSKKNQKVRIYHGSTNSTRAQQYRKDEVLDISNLNRVIKIDLKKRYVLVEPNVPMDVLVDETLKFGLIPPVIMEFPGITVGGGIQGGAGESSSFRWGLFNNCFLEYEILLGNGTVVTASQKRNQDLFAGIACSYGSLGIITLAKLKLIPAKPFVNLTYIRVRNFQEALSVIKNWTQKQVDFIDAIMFSKTLGVVMVGKLTSDDNHPQVSFTRATDEWFFLHAEKIAGKYSHWEETIPIKDYLFRYDRGAFWMGRQAFQLFHVPFNRAARFFLNRFFKTRTMYRFLHALNISQKFFVQDLCLPQENVTSFFQYIEDKTHIYPIWICPLKPTRQEFLAPTNLNTGLVINLGVWGRIRGSFSTRLEVNREIERTVEKYKGRKVLYAHSYYSRDEFWKIYDKKQYEGLRKKYQAENIFVDIYDKTHVSGEYKISLIGALRGTISSLFQSP